MVHKHQVTTLASDIHNTYTILYANALLKIAANSLDFSEETGVLPETQFGFRRQRSTTDMMFVRWLQEMERVSNVPLNMCFTDLRKVYDSEARTLL